MKMGLSDSDVKRQVSKLLYAQIQTKNFICVRVVTTSLIFCHI